MGAKDTVSKELLKRIAIDIARCLLHLRVDRAEIIETANQRVEERRADLVARMEGEDGCFILHIEIQNDNDPQIPWRMLRYRTDIALASAEHARADIRQTLIYIGRAKLSMPSSLAQDGLDYRYRVIDMHTVDCHTLIEQDTPEALVLAILCDFKDRPAREVVREILLRLEQKTRDNNGSNRFRDYMLMLEILSTNRDLRIILQEEEKMLSQVRYSDLPSFHIGLELGIEQGREQGHEQGHEQGFAHGETVTLRRQLVKRFGPIPAEIDARITAADQPSIEAWLDRIIEANSLADMHF